MASSVPANVMLVVFCPFAAGYYLSYFYRYVNAVIAMERMLLELHRQERAAP